MNNHKIQQHYNDYDDTIGGDTYAWVPWIKRNSLGVCISDVFNHNIRWRQQDGGLWCNYQHTPQRIVRLVTATVKNTCFIYWYVNLCSSISFIVKPNIALLLFGLRAVPCPARYTGLALISCWPVNNYQNRWKLCRARWCLTAALKERLRGQVGSALDHRLLPPELEYWHGHIWRVFHLWLRFITFGGRSTHFSLPRAQKWP